MIAEFKAAKFKAPGPILDQHIAFEIWLQLHQTKNKFGKASFIPTLNEGEQKLYDCLTLRFCHEAAIVSVETSERLPDSGGMR